MEQNPTKLVAGSALGLAVFTVAVVLYRSGAGIDLTDEGFYLNWMQTPGEYPAALTFFGYLYAPFFRLLDGDIVVLRILNLGATLALAYWLMRTVWSLDDPGRPMPVRFSLQLLPLALSGWMILRLWLPTPSYNWLNMQGLLLVAIGCSRLMTVGSARENDRQTPLRAGLLIGIGGFLVAFAKPVSGVMLAGLLVLVALPFGRARFIAFAVAAAVAACLSAFAILLIDGSVAGFVARITLGLEQLARLDGGQRLIRLDRPPLSIPGLAAGLLMLALGFGLSLHRQPKARTGLAVLSLVLACGAGLAVWRGDLLPAPGRWFIGLMLVGGLAGVLAASLSWPGVRLWRALRAHWRLVVVLMAMPLVFTAGTGNSSWTLIPFALAFWVAAAALLLAASLPEAGRETGLAAAGLVIALSGAFGLAISMEAPYRQPAPLRLQTTVTAVGLSGGRLRLDEGTARYIGTLRSALIAGNAGSDKPILDLTGMHPGTVYLVGGQAPGAAWLISGYPGSEALIRQQLALVSCEMLARAWLLSADQADMPFMPAVLTANGLDPAQDYAEFARASAPGNGRLHRLMQPVGEVALREAACKARRAAMVPRS